MTTDFEYLNLAEVNPDIPPIPPASYNFTIVGAERKLYTLKKDDDRTGKKAGEPASYIQFRFAITDDAEQAGRQVYVSVFPNERNTRALRRLQDFTGVQQDNGMTLDEWLTALVTERATFNAPLYTGVNKTTGKPTNEVSLGSIQAAA